MYVYIYIHTTIRTYTHTCMYLYKYIYLCVCLWAFHVGQKSTSTPHAEHSLDEFLIIVGVRVRERERERERQAGRGDGGVGGMGRRAVELKKGLGRTWISWGGDVEGGWGVKVQRWEVIRRCEVISNRRGQRSTAAAIGRLRACLACRTWVSRRWRSRRRGR